VLGGALHVAVANLTASSCGIFMASAPLLPVAGGAGVAWAQVASYSGGGDLRGMSASADALSIYLAVHGVGIVRGTRASSGSSAFGSFATSPASPANAVDVLVNANGWKVYTLTPGSLGYLDVSPAGSGGSWAGAHLVALASAPSDGTVFSGLALSP
jgi:hypothetical protein